ncbi:RNA methyltransferase [Bombilactobacillus folatiphilus]|uniref:RNA methyltransferase n=1 Tax=Bombilactobacillus folatiphilus TaxID=2923362 RepID=A0ABY4PAH5_9LACO|nr:RNA methyltransferase [Bombilactobacillus folatiphilus]UQS82554.1 RNA methyltransferase [Bombilactobacillus folatiphilus]
MVYISSTQNTKIKELKKLQTHKGRKKQQRYLLEGEHLIFEALQQQISLQDVYVTTDYLNRDPKHLVRDHFPNAIEISREVAQALGETVTPQGIIAVTPLVALQAPTLTHGTWLLLDQIQDPGNVGTMIRTADAAGFTGVILSPDSADFYSAKVQRAMQGSQFHLQIQSMELTQAIEQLKAAQIPVYGTLVDETAQPYQTLTAPQQFALIMGNEAHGLNPDLAKLTDLNLYIPILGQAESLNVGVAAGILIYRLSV